jgi:hypothetical protein
MDSFEPASVLAGTGSPEFSRAVEVRTATSRAEIDAALAALHEHKKEWSTLALKERIAILGELRRGLDGVAERWVAASVEAKGIPPGSSRVGEEWGAVAVIQRLLRLIERSLREVERFGRPRFPGRVRSAANGQLIVPVFPLEAYDRIFYPGVSAELWLEPGITRARLYEEQAAIYRRLVEPKVALVLGAGNYSNLGPGDLLYKLFSELQVVALKMNPVNAYLGPLLEEAFGALVRRGFLRVLYGGAEEGAYLAEHPLVDELHLPGSDKTHDAIVFGAGEEGRRRKAERRPRLTKRFTSELGSVSPLIVVPGPWSEDDLAYQAEHIASTLTLNAGFNCLSTRLIVQHRAWAQRGALLEAIRRVLARIPTRRPYYPGARQIHQRFLGAHPEAEQLGPGGDALPWTLIPGVDPQRAEDICFRTEAFCGLFSETALDARSAASFLDAAVDFVNEGLWGTLTATLLVHPASLREPAVAAAVDRAVARLRYGTVGVNLWGAMGFLIGVPSWGAYPGHPSHDIQSGSGVVNNTLMLPQVQKSVLRGPFRQPLKPPTFALHKTLAELFQRAARFEASPSVRQLPGILWAALRG